MNNFKDLRNCATFGIRIKETSYKGEIWYSAEGGFSEWGDIAFGRTPGRAVAFLLEKMAHRFKSGHISVPTPYNEGIVSEILDITYKEEP